MIRDLALMVPSQVEGAGVMDASAASGVRDRLRREQRHGPPRTYDMCLIDAG